MCIQNISNGVQFSLVHMHTEIVIIELTFRFTILCFVLLILI
jgi:hypothetical protein